MEIVELPRATLEAALWDTVASMMPPRQRAEKVGERELANALRVRDEGVLVRVQAELGPLLLGYLTAMLGDRTEAEDIAQVTLLEVWERGPSFDRARGSLITWVMMIARSRAIDRLRQRVPEPRDPADPGMLPADRAVTQQDPTEALLEQWRVAYLLAQLPAEQSRMLRMRFYDGLSQQQIAAQTETPLGTVKMRMVQALERLRQLIDEEGPIP